MIKRIIVFIIIAIVLTAGVVFLVSFIGKVKQVSQQEKIPSSDKENNEVLKATLPLDNIFELAKQGKILGSNIIVGKTITEEVQQFLGQPEGTSETNADLLLNDASLSIDVDITDNVVSNLRSSQEQFTVFDLNTIESFKQPDDTVYYKDERNDQMILVYELPNDFSLKWVLPKPIGDSDNPTVDHISLSKEIHTDNGNGENGVLPSDKIIEKMTLDEKIGQMIFSGVNGTEMTNETKNIIKNYHVGGIILFGNNIENITQTVDFLNEIKSVNSEENLSPLLLGVDEEGGNVTRIPDEMKYLPPSRLIGNLDNPDVSFNVGTILSKQMNALGFNLNFAPVLDVNSNPNNPVIGNRSLGDNPSVVARLGIQTMKGIQSEEVISVMKHFPGHGDTSVDSHLELPKVNKSYTELSELELIPFKKAISEGADMSMTAHILLPKIDQEYPASMSNKIITGILRDEYGFDGVVITDDLTMSAITDHYSIEEAAVQSVKAGSDLLLVAHDPNLVAKVFDKLKIAVENGEINEKRIDKSVERIAQLKEKYQLSDEQTSIPDVQPINKEVEAIWQKVP